MAPSPSRGDPGNANGPRVGAHEPFQITSRNTQYTTRCRVAPADVERHVDTLTMPQMLAALDPVDELWARVTGGDTGAPPRCPCCGKRAIEVRSPLLAWCAQCRARLTRFGVRNLVLGDYAAVCRIDEALTEGVC